MTAPQTMQLWQPIATAPKNQDILVYAPSPDQARWPNTSSIPEIIIVTRWHKDAGFCVGIVREVTHWMPAPKPPQQV